MPRVPNPYFAGPPASHPDTFFGRQDTLGFVDETLASLMQNVIVFYGQRRIGKTSILHQIAHRASRDYQAIFFDLQSSVDSPAHDLLYGLAYEVANKFKLPTPDRTHFQHNPDTFRTNFLPRVYKHLGRRRLLLLLDEFDALSPETAPAELDALPFVKTLNRIIQGDDKNVAFLFVVGRRLKDLTSQQLQIFRGARDRQIGLLKRNATWQLITHPAEGILHYEDSTIERIWALTSGHPYFTQLICYEIFRQLQPQNVSTVTEAHVDAVIDDAISGGQSALQWYWDEVPAVERFALYTIGQLTAEDGGATIDQLIVQRDAQRVQVSDLELRALPDKLVDRQVLKRDSDEHYRFAVELVRRWIVRSHSLEEVATELSRAAIDELAKALFEAGRAAVRANDVNLAIDNFSRALSINSDYVEARLWLARTRARAGDLLGAIDEFAYVERFGGPEKREARLGLADVRAQYGQRLEKEGKVDEAMQEYRRVLEMDSQHRLANARLSEIFRQQADQHLENEGIVAVQSYYEQALKLNLDVNDLERLENKIKERLERYSQVQQKINNWEEAERASRLSSTLMSKAGDNQEALLRVQLGWARWHLGQHELETAATVYHRLLEETIAEIPRQVIENDILRYSQEQEEQNNWSRAETALALLVNLFPDDIENQNRLADSLCRQGEFLLEQDEFTQAEAAYRRALASAPENEALPGLIRSGFQSYRRTRIEDDTVQTRKLVQEAMSSLVHLLTQDDILAYQWLSKARTELGHALRAENRLAEAQEVYQEALNEAVHLLHLAVERDQTYRFDEAAERLEQALRDATPDRKLVDRIKTTFNDYRHQLEKMLRWNQARRAMETLDRLVVDDDEVRFWLAETHVSQADWHLQLAIPDLDEARHLARSALNVHLPHQKTELVAKQIKDSFQDHCERHEQARPPNWSLAEQMMSRLVGLLPDDREVHRWLADTRARQAHWYLTQESQNLVEARQYLIEAAEVCRRALDDLSGDQKLITGLKNSFRTYYDRHRQMQPPALPLAKQAIRNLAELLPEDEEVQQWLVAAETEVESPPEKYLWQRWPAIAMVFIVGILCLGVGLFSGNGFGGSDNPIAMLFTANKPAATITPNATPSSSASGTEVIVVAATPSPTPLATLTSAPKITLTPTLRATSTVPKVTNPPAPTDTSTALQPTYAAPTLISPGPGESFQGINSPPRLEWSSIEKLAAEHYYLLVLQFLENGELTLYPTWLKETAWEVPTEIFFRVDRSEPKIQWWVTVVDDDRNTELSDHSETQTFSWEPYLAPQLLRPNNGAVFHGVSPAPELEWEPIKALNPTEFYMVKLQFLRDGQPYVYSWELRDSTWEVNTQMFDLMDSGVREIQWQVVAAREDETGEVIEISERSEIGVFTWQAIPLKLAYVKTIGTDHNLYLATVTNLEVSKTERLPVCRAAGPAWSPDGLRLAFLGEVGIEYCLSNSPGGSGVWLYVPVTRKIELLQEDDRVKHISWSPNSSLIAYESTKDTDESRIFFMDVNGKTKKGNIRGEQPAWSPENSRIMMKACRPQGCGLWTVDLHGATPQRVTSHGTDSFPHWLGNQVVFASERSGNWDIYQVTVDNMGQSLDNPKQLTTHPAHDTNPVYTPDGRHIFFRSNRDGEWGIWVMGADGANQRLLIPTGGSDAWNREKFSIQIDNQ